MSYEKRGNKEKAYKELEEVEEELKEKRRKDKVRIVIVEDAEDELTE
jgi:hypothetical protein